MGLAAQRIGLVVPTKGISRQTVRNASSSGLRSLREKMAKGAVEWSPDLQRVLELPRRSKPEHLQAIAEGLTMVLKKPEGTQQLRLMQAWWLLEAPQADGMFAVASVGSGKTLAFMLTPMVFKPIQQPDGTYRPLRAVLFIRPDLRAQFAADWERYGQHWNLPNLAGGRWFQPGRPTLHVVAYSELSHTKSSAMLEQINPDLVMADEVSSFRSFDSAKMRRMRRHFAEHPQTRFIGADATPMSDSVNNFWHLLAWALDVGSPMPLEQSEVQRWARALDPEGYDREAFMPGELQRLCREGEPIRTGFQRRLIDTLGVVVTEDRALNIPLVFKERRPPKMPEAIRNHLTVLRRKGDGGWKRPDGELLLEMKDVVECAKQLAEGFYLKWVFPRNESKEVKDRWFLLRQNWNRELRAKLQNAEVHLDSPKLCENAAERWYAGGCTGCDRGPEQWHIVNCPEADTHPLWPSYCWLAWKQVKDTVHHITVAHWESDWLLLDAAAWAASAPGIVWVDHPAFGHKLAAMTGLPYYGGGDRAAEEMTQFNSGKPATHSIICSIDANTRGKNLQDFSRNLFVGFPTSNDTLEQVVGRTFRPGQTASKVTVDYYLQSPEFENAFEKCKERAHAVEGNMGSKQMLCYGTWEAA